MSTNCWRRPWRPEEKPEEEKPVAKARKKALPITGSRQPTSMDATMETKNFFNAPGNLERESPRDRMVPLGKMRPVYTGI